MRILWRLYRKYCIISFMDNFNGLTKKERKELKKELELKDTEVKRKKDKITKYLIVGLISLLIVGGLFWFIKKESVPKPGQSLPELGRDHVPESTKVDYNSNPPTSGSHSEQWEKPGIYDKPLNDLKLVHSLEHGYIIISYNCDFKKKESSNLEFITRANAHEEDKVATDSSGNKLDASASGYLEIADWKNDKDCQKLVTQLSDVAQKKGLQKLIVVPRPNLDNRIALTAWTRLDKFYDFEEKRIVTFIDEFRDQGPEKTME